MPGNVLNTLHAHFDTAQMTELTCSGQMRSSSEQATSTATHNDNRRLVPQRRPAARIQAQSAWRYRAHQQQLEAKPASVRPGAIALLKRSADKSTLCLSLLYRPRQGMGLGTAPLNEQAHMPLLAVTLVTTPAQESQSIGASRCCTAHTWRSRQDSRALRLDAQRREQPRSAGAAASPHGRAAP